MTSFKFSTQVRWLATKPTFYLLSLLFLAYLRQSLHFIQQHYSERRDIDLTKELIKSLENLAPNLQSLVQGQGENCKVCDPRWLSRLETRLTSSLLGLLMSVFFFYKLVRGRCVSRAKMMSLAVTQLWQTWKWAAKDLGNESEKEIKNGKRSDRVQYEDSTIPKLWIAICVLLVLFMIHAEWEGFSVREVATDDTAAPKHPRLKRLKQQFLRFLPKTMVPYVLLFLALAYLRLFLYFCKQYYSKSLDLESSRRLADLLQEHASELLPSVQDKINNWQRCSPFLFGQIKSRMVISLIGLLSTLLCLCRPFAQNHVVRGILLGFTIGQIWPAMDMVVKDSRRGNQDGFVYDNAYVPKIWIMACALILLLILCEGYEGYNSTVRVPSEGVLKPDNTPESKQDVDLREQSQSVVARIKDGVTAISRKREREE